MNMGHFLLHLLGTKEGALLLFAVVSAVMTGLGRLYVNVAHGGDSPEVKEYIVAHDGFYFLLFLLMCFPAFLLGWQALELLMPNNPSADQYVWPAGLSGVSVEMLILNGLFQWNLRRHLRGFAPGRPMLLGKRRSGR